MGAPEGTLLQMVDLGDTAAIVGTELDGTGRDWASGAGKCLPTPRRSRSPGGWRSPGGAAALMRTVRSHIFINHENLNFSMWDLVEDQNPWWSGSRDPHLERLDSLRYKVRPDWIDRLSLEPFSLNFVLGPRQVGKTTGIKMLIRRLIGRGEFSVLYLNCEIFSSFRELLSALREYQRVKEREGIENSYIFLDEVTSLEGWWRAVKSSIDSGALLKDVVTVTGSSSLKVRRDVELVPGRRGRGVVIEVLPLTFPQYRELVDPGAITGGRLLGLFRDYLETGGFLPRINGLPASDVLWAYVNEVVRFGRSLEILREVMAGLFKTAPSPVSYRGLASYTSGYSYKVVQSYLEFMQDLYLIGQAPLWDGGVKYRRERKFFFRDPLLAGIFSSWSDQSFLESAVYEWVVQEHVYRRYGRVYYHRNDYEVDVVANGLRVEVKAGKAHRRYPRGVVVLEEDIPEFLLGLGGGGSPALRRAPPG